MSVDEKGERIYKWEAMMREALDDGVVTYLVSPTLSILLSIL
jgi:hypothetical protein